MPILSRTDYRNIKQMDRQALEDYLKRVYKRGYDAGHKAANTPKSAALSNKTEEKPAVDIQNSGMTGIK